MSWIKWTKSLLRTIASKLGFIILIFIFPSLSFLVYFITHSFMIVYSRIVYYTFNNSYPKEVLSYQWATLTDLPLSNAIIYAILSGVVASLIGLILIFLLTKSSFIKSIKSGDRAILKSASLLGAYLIGFLLSSFAFYRYFLNLTDFLPQLIIAAMYYFSSFFYFHNNERKLVRREDYGDTQTWLKRLELEHSSLKENLHYSLYTLILVSISLLGAIFTNAYSEPTEIFSFYARWNVTLLFVFGVVAYPMIVFFTGIVGQLLSSMEDTYMVIEEKMKEKIKKES